MNNRGALTLDFLFAFVLVMGLSMVIMAFSVSMTLVEVVQYISFASARSYFAGNASKKAQQQAALKTFSEFKNAEPVKTLLNGNWIEIESPIVDTNLGKNPKTKEYVTPNPFRDMFTGVVVDINLKVLDFNIPFFGRTKKSGQGQAAGFPTRVGSFVGREPSFDECYRFTQDRWNAIKRLEVPAGFTPYSSAVGNSYAVMVDNGC